MTWPQWLCHKVLDLTIEHGYRPWQAVAWMLMFLLIGCVVFGVAGYFEQMLELKERPLPDFNFFFYSLDTLVPLVDLRQASYRLPEPWWARGYL